MRKGVVQEALSNILKLSSADKVKIEMIGTTDAVDLEFGDNGKGLSRKQATGAA